MKQKKYNIINRSLHLLVILYIPFFNLVFSSHNTIAQTSPVQIGVLGIPPYPTHIGDFAAGTADHIKLQLLLTDLGATSTVWLRMKMSGPSLNIQTNENTYKPTFELTGGVPVTLGLADLAGFFNINNLSGTNPTQFA